MKNLKVRTLWIIIIVLFLIAIGLIISCAYTDDVLNKVVIVFLGIDFILLTILVQYASFRTFKYKAKPNNYIQKEYECTGDINLEKLKYVKRKRNYGESYLKINGESAYKVVFINDINGYFNQDQEDNQQHNKELEKCNKFIGIEIFNDYDEESIIKIQDFSIQGDKLYYTVLIKKEDKYVCVNYLEPNDFHKENYEIILNDLNLKEISE